MKKALGITYAAATFLTLAPFAFAETLCPVGTFGNLCTLQIDTLIGKFIQLIFIIAVLAALFYLIWGGFKWLTSGGDKTAVASAREHIIAAIIGLIVIFLSYFILNILIKFFVPGFNIGSFVLPSL